jgi:hypothetical protein
MALIDAVVVVNHTGDPQEESKKPYQNWHKKPP